MSKNPFKLTKLTDIKPYERNPRVISQAAVDAVAKSIQAFGFRQPIVVDKDGVILAGHTRYKAACQLGLAEVPVVWASDITDLQAKGYRIADNKTAELSAWDRDGLDTEIKELAGTEIDLDALGVSDWELERILHDSGAHDIEPFQPMPAPLSAQPQPMPAPLSAQPQTNTWVAEASSVPLCVELRFSSYDEIDEFFRRVGISPSGTVEWKNLEPCVQLASVKVFDPDTEDLQRAAGSSCRKHKARTK